uniref:hypothetical protein n=1 Tax=Salmonella enterica TaxID=28901 RepID=UPI0035263D22
DDGSAIKEREKDSKKIEERISWHYIDLNGAFGLFLFSSLWFIFVILICFLIEWDVVRENIEKFS